MALSPQEQEELQQLESKYGKPKSSGLSPMEEDELKTLEAKYGSSSKSQPQSLGQTALEQGGNALTMGYLPQLQAAAQPAIFGLMNKITGQNIEPDSYVDARDASVKRLADQQEQNPKTALAAQVGGGLLGAVATPIPGGPARSLLGAIGRGVGVGAVQGALQNPGDAEGVVDPVQLGARAENAKTGAVIGGVSSAAAGLAKKGLDALANSGETLKKIGRTQAVKASGAMLKDFRQLMGKDMADDVGQFALDKKLVQAGDTYESVAQKAEALNSDAGSRLKQIYETAKKSIPSALEASGKDIDKLSDDEFFAMAKTGFNPLRDGESIIEAAKDKLGDAVGAKSALRRLSNYLKTLTVKYGDTTLDPKTANDIKSAIDLEINYSRNPLSREPDVETAMSAARKFLAKKIDDHIAFIGKFSGDPKAAEALREANRDYGYSKQIMNMASDKVARESSNRMFGLTDTIAGSAGGAAGAVAGSVLGDKHDAIELSALGALVGGAGNKLARTYGNAALASGTNKMGNIANRTVAPLGAGVSKAFNPELVSRGLLEAGLLRNQKNEKKKK